VERRILVVDITIGQGNDIILVKSRIENGIVVNVVIVAFDHQATCCIPNHIVMHGAVLPCSYLANWSIKANTILDDIMNPIVGNFSARCFALHNLHNSSIGLQMADIPHFVVEYSRRIANGKHG